MVPASAKRILAALFVILMQSALPHAGASVQSATITVNSTEDSIANDGKCTLREAIIAANENAVSGTAAGECAAGAAGKDQIVFALGAGTPTINVVNTSFVNLALPPVVEPVIINGHTGGATRIEINGGGRQISCLYVVAGDSVISSLVINRFGAFALQMDSKGGNVVEDCYIGLDASGETAAGNQFGIYVASPNNRMGSADPARRNLISGNQVFGILLDTEAAGCQVLGNYIGTNVTGTAAVGNGVGLVVYSPNNVIGGKTAGAGNVISGNQRTGIEIGGIRGFRVLPLNPTDNQVMGNFIGVDASGLAKLGNGTNGISLINGALRNVVGDEQISGRNIISGNGQHGIEAYCISLTLTGDTQSLQGIALSDNDVSRIRGNFIGVDGTGKGSLGNGQSGISISCGKEFLIGGEQVGARNIISGNEINGISILGPGLQTVRIHGNFIGADETGTAGLGNQFHGISASGSANVEVGSTIPGTGNLISANGMAGVDAGSAIVVGNYIGTDITGTKALGNLIGVTGRGLIGGDTPAARNVISGNRQRGIVIGGGRVMGNYIGTTASGTTPLPNLSDGITVVGNGSQIGGFVAGARNVISGNGRIGIALSNSSFQSLVVGNYIGLDATGTVAMGNQRGIEIAGSDNTIGIPGAFTRNVISGNLGGGVRIIGAQTRGNTLLGNFIGTNADGSASIGPSDYGVSIEDAYFNYIGGIRPGEGNVISGNTTGVLITGSSATQNRVTGNFIGVDATGAKAVPNNDGILIAAAAGNFVGESSEAARNVISGNNRRGIVIAGSDPPGNFGNLVTGNFIGLNAAGNAAIGNRMHGIWLTQGAAYSIIGGSAAAARNVISGNEGNGIQIENASRTRVIGNFIGTDASGVNDLGNLQNGVVTAGVGYSQIGSTDPGEGNVIAFNHRNGVLRATLAGSILSNSIFSNGEEGINLPGTNSTAFYTPLLGSATIANGQTIVQGTIVSAPKTSFLIQFFANPVCDSTGFGEGKSLIGQITVNAAESQQISVTTPFLATLPTVATPVQIITATATWYADPLIDFTRMTSEFSACVSVVSPAITVSDVTVSEGNFPATTFAAFTVTLSGAQGTSQPIKVDYATSDGTARSFLDYVEARGTLSFNPPFNSNQITQTVFVTINSDNQEEPDESFSLTLSNPVNAFLQKPLGAGVILDASNRFDAPGIRLPDAAAASDHKPGSLLVFPVYTSNATSPNSQNTRISLTNAANNRSAYVRLFFVNGGSGAVADSYICLTPNQTTAFLISDIDPGVTGFLIAVAVDSSGCPARFNALVGDEHVKFASGQAANLGALSVAALQDAPATCESNLQLAQLRFDDVHYNALPQSVAVSNLGDRSTGNDALLILNRLGGNLAVSASPLGAMSGLLFDDVEGSYSFAFTASACQFLSPINGNFPRTNPRFDQIVLSGRSGWMKLWTAEDAALCGAVLNFNGNARSTLGAFNQGHNLHALATTKAAQLTLPILTPPCQ